MKKIILIVFSLAMMTNISGQSLPDNMSAENKRLLERLKQDENERKQKVDTYVSNNPNVARYLYKEGELVAEIRDIIDGKPIYISIDNDEAGKATKTNTIMPGGELGLNLDGANMTVGVWDGGPAQSSHPEFMDASNTNSRITVIDNSTVDGDSGFSSHGTHVTGTIAAKGVNASAKGMAINVNVRSYNWTNDNSEIVLAINNPTTPIILSNHSYGVLIDDGSGGGPIDSWIMGAYTSDARDVDEIIHNNPHYLLVASAGNGGNTFYSGGLFNGFDKLTTDKNAKNSLLIANANPTLAPFTNEIVSLTINSSSSQGPTDDLRIKPDIAADGTNLLSTVPTNNYAVFSGTSMSAPNTTGTLVLLQQYYNQLNAQYMLASTLRGLVCHTALDDSSTGPDPIFGWGFLDAKASAELIADDASNDALIDELSLTNGETYTYTFSAEAGTALKATICWTDLPGAAVFGAAELNNPTPRLVNDLDLRITKDGTTYLPWKLDYSSSSGFSNSLGDNNVDNIERIDINVPESGTYTLTVTHKGTLQGDSGGPFDPQSQDFSLIITGNNLTLGVNDNDFNSRFAVWPNPTNDKLNFSLKSNYQENVQTSLIDMQGRVVMNNAFTFESQEGYNTLDVSQLESGIYTLYIKQGKHEEKQKVIIK